MGIDARVHDEDGRAIAEVGDPHFLTEILLGDNLAQTVCLRFIDPYGDATFNQAQIPVLLSELKPRVAACANAAAKSHGEELLRLIRSAQDKVHTYLTFVGD